jgi:hypothetical protein
MLSDDDSVDMLTPGWLEFRRDFFFPTDPNVGLSDTLRDLTRSTASSKKDIFLDSACGVTDSSGSSGGRISLK